MKFQPKRFVVEVKRGTSRSAFASPDASADRFSSAEAMLFGRTPKGEPEPAGSVASKHEAPGGRILRSLVEPVVPIVEDLPVRRGRKPGSKNKPKPEMTLASADVVSERPRRGRKPGSKNKPKVPVLAGSSDFGAPYDMAAAMRSYGFAEDGTVLQDIPQRSPEPSRAPPAPVFSPVAAEAGTRQPGPLRPRLRDRSTILKRYVLDIEPLPGQPGALKARRLARAAR